MNIQTAYKTLGLNQKASQDEVKKAFRKLAAKHHPDKGGDEVKFKEINTAYQILTGKQQGDINIKWPYVGRTYEQGFTDDFQKEIFNAFFRNVKYNNPFTNVRGVRPERRIYLSISFNESILGARIDLKEKLPDHNLKGYVDIHPGIKNGDLIELFHFREGNDEFDEEVYFIIRVQDSEDGLYREGVNVYSELDLTLLEALTGCTKEIITVQGKRKIKIPPKIKNGFKVKLSGFGVRGIGDHIAHINVNYPENVAQIIELLKEKKPEEQQKEENDV